MIREIKFRAFIDGEMVYMNDLYKFRFENGREYDFDYVLQTKKQVMQNTGLKDHNSIEIYEGDIVIADEDDGKDIVVFKKGSFYIESLSNRKFDDELLSDVEVKVIGNKYETPELLEKR